MHDRKANTTEVMWIGRDNKRFKNLNKDYL